MRKPMFPQQFSCPECENGIMTIKSTYQTAGAITGATIACLNLLHKARFARTLLALGAGVSIPAVSSVAVRTLGGVLVWTLTGIELGRYLDEEVVGLYQCQSCKFTAKLHFLKKDGPIE